MAVCGKCSSVIENQESISCVECKTSYHTKCVQVRSAKLQTVRATWKCDRCATEPSKEQASSGGELTAILRGIESLTQQLQGVNNNVTEMKTQLAAVNETITGIKSQLEILTQENLARKNEYTEIKKENADLKTEVITLRRQIQENEQYSRRDNVEIVGVPYSQKENIYELLNNIASVIDVSFSKVDVSIAHRLPDIKKTGKPNILVRFVNRFAKTEWINAGRVRKPTATDLCTSWESSKIYFNDHLTFNNKRLLGHLRGLVREKKIFAAWSRDCKVMMRALEDGPVLRITDMDDITKALSK